MTRALTSKSVLLSFIALLGLSVAACVDVDASSLPPSAWDVFDTRQTPAIDAARSDVEINLSDRSPIQLPLSGRIGMIRDGSELVVDGMDIKIPSFALSGGTLSQGQVRLGVQLRMPLPEESGGITRGEADLLMDGTWTDSNGAISPLATRKGLGAFSVEALKTTTPQGEVMTFTLDVAMPAKAMNRGGAWPAVFGDVLLRLVYEVKLPPESQ
jgi:hypothetical protein